MSSGANGYLNNSSNSPPLLGPPTNSLSRSRSRSPSHLSYADTRRSVSPNFPRKSLNIPPSINRSRSPTPNFTSTHLTKLTTNRSPQHVLQKNYGPQSLPTINSGPQSLPAIIPTSPKSKHVSNMQIPADAKVGNYMVVEDQTILLGLPKNFLCNDYNHCPISKTWTIIVAK